MYHQSSVNFPRNSYSEVLLATMLILRRRTAPFTQQQKTNLVRRRVRTKKQANPFRNEQYLSLAQLQNCIDEFYLVVLCILKKVPYTCTYKKAAYQNPAALYSTYVLCVGKEGVVKPFRAKRTCLVICRALYLRSSVSIVLFCT